MRVSRLLASVSFAAVIIGQSVLAAEHDLPTAKPESVGMSAERLALLPEGMKQLVDQGHLAGVVTMVSRHGKVVEFDAAGKRDIAANAPIQKDSIFPHLLHEQAHHRRGHDDVVRRGQVAAE